MWSSSSIGRDDSRRCLVDSRASTIHACFVFFAILLASHFRASVSWGGHCFFVPFSTALPPPLEFPTFSLRSWWFLDIHIFRINEINTSEFSSIVELWFLVRPSLLFSFLSGFPNLGPYFRPYMIWSSCRLNFCQSPPGPHILFWRFVCSMEWTSWILSKNLINFDSRPHSNKHQYVLLATVIKRAILSSTLHSGSTSSRASLPSNAGTEAKNTTHLLQVCNPPYASHNFILHMLFPLQTQWLQTASDANPWNTLVLHCHASEEIAPTSKL